MRSNTGVFRWQDYEVIIKSSNCMPGRLSSLPSAWVPSPFHSYQVEAQPWLELSQWWGTHYPNFTTVVFVTKFISYWAGTLSPSLYPLDFPSTSNSSVPFPPHQPLSYAKMEIVITHLGNFFDSSANWPLQKGQSIGLINIYQRTSSLQSRHVDEHVHTL